ncbi:MAG: phytoene desaturase [Caldithrix sp.]|nr:phytoene desaturase [Caldithrix sp.]
MKKAIIVGSGFGGLSAAIRLQAKGFQVTILEKNEQVGGHANQLIKDGYTFDLGPSLITAPDIIRDIFNSAGKKMEDYLDLIYLDPFYRIFFHDGSKIDYTADSEAMKEQLTRFNPNDAKNYDAFMKYVREVYKAVIEDGLGSRPFMDAKSLFQFLPRALKLKAYKSTYGVVKQFFKDERSRFTFSFHPLFIGGSPFRSPAVYLMIPYLEKAGGVWFTKGGMYSLVKALQTVFLEIDGQIKTSAEVQEIRIENGRATGVVANDAFYEADIVISNAHFAHTYKDLIQPQARRKWTDKKVLNLDYSMSSFLIYMGARKQYTDQLLHHTLILSHRYKELVRDIFDRKILPDDYSMYLHAPTRTDPQMAPQGGDSLYLLIPVPNLAGDINWAEQKDIFADKVLKFIDEDFGLGDLREHLQVKEIFTPVDFATQRNNYLGSAWGVEPRLLQTANFRPHNRSEDIPNLYIVGASTHPGAGVPGVMLTAQATVNTIFTDFNM